MSLKYCSILKGFGNSHILYFISILDYMMRNTSLHFIKLSFFLELVEIPPDLPDCIKSVSV